MAATNNHDSQSVCTFYRKCGQHEENGEDARGLSLKTRKRSARLNAAERESIIRSFYVLNRSVRSIARRVDRPEAQIEAVLREEKERVANLTAKCRLLLTA